MEDFIDDNLIEDILKKAERPERAQVEDIIAKAKQLKGLTPEETAVLLQTEEPDLLNLIYETARDVKRKIYGNRLVLFAPLYISNYCANNCLYCGFRRDNRDLNRVALTMDQIAEEVKVLEREGHKRILMLCGEHPARSGIDYFLEAVETVYATKTEKGGEIRRINVEIAPLGIPEYRRLKEAKIGTYVLFQETYHHTTYKAMHPKGPKSDFAWRLTAMDRAQQGGIDDVGIGALFGLYDYKYEVLGLLFHALHLEKRFGVGPHTISIPRLEPAVNAPAAIKPPRPVADEEFKKLIACIRLAVPYTGIILTTRENAQMRAEAYELGVSQISAGSRTDPGGYHDRTGEGFSAGQFNLGDTRNTDEVIYDITTRGYIPSFCTACYRLGRTGADFMDLAKPGLIRKFCTTNAVLSFKEYLVDYASEKTKKSGEALIEELLQDTRPSMKELLETRLNGIEEGQRDLAI